MKEVQREERAENRAFLKFFCKTMLPQCCSSLTMRKEWYAFCSFLRFLKAHFLQDHASHSLHNHGNNDKGYFHHVGQSDESVGNTTLSERDLSHTFYPVRTLVNSGQNTRGRQMGQQEARVPT